jgi:excisionase family DNA binding protein
MLLEELGGVLKMPKSTRYKLFREGKLPSHKIGRHGRFRQKAMDRWLKAMWANEPGSGGDR